RPAAAARRARGRRAEARLRPAGRAAAPAPALDLARDRAHARRALPVRVRRRASGRSAAGLRLPVHRAPRLRTRPPRPGRAPRPDRAQQAQRAVRRAGRADDGPVRAHHDRGQPIQAEGPVRLRRARVRAGLGLPGQPPRAARHDGRPRRLSGRECRPAAGRAGARRAMTTLAAASPDALPALGALAAAHGIECTVQTGLADPDAVAQVAALAREGVAIDADPGRVARARTVLQAHGLRGARVLQGHPPRVLADLRRQLPARTLWFRAAGDVPVPTVRDSPFAVPRGEGLGAVAAGPAAGRGLADVEDQLVRWSPDHGTEVLAGPDGRALLVAWPQPRVHVTFLIEKYTHGYGTAGLSINLDNLVATLAATGLATYDVVHYDER